MLCPAPHLERPENIPLKPITNPLQGALLVAFRPELLIGLAPESMIAFPPDPERIHSGTAITFARIPQFGHCCAESLPLPCFGSIICAPPYHDHEHPFVNINSRYRGCYHLACLPVPSGEHTKTHTHCHVLPFVLNANSEHIYRFQSALRIKHLNSLYRATVVPTSPLQHRPPA